MGFSISKLCVSGPVITTNFPDPAIIFADNTWYAFGTSTRIDNPGVFVQVASSPDFSSWKVHTGEDALPELPSWVNQQNPQVWAPDVVQRKDGEFVLYYSAVAKKDNTAQHHCVGVATSKTVTGPYKAISDDPLVCPLESGGAIDPSGFKDKDGTMYVLWKVDGNSIGHGGVCGNTDGTIVPTPIMIQEVKDDGVTLVGEATQILTNGPEDGPLVEAPSMMRSADGHYVLYYSAHCWSNANYNTAYAVSRSPKGPFVKADKALLEDGTVGLIGPGGATIAADGHHMAFHGYTSKSELGKSRAMYVAMINADTKAKCLT